MYFVTSVNSPISKFVQILEVAVEVKHADGRKYSPYYAFTLYFYIQNASHASETLCYKPEGRGFDSRLSHWIFQLT
jgi:hypothetical protein